MANALFGITNNLTLGTIAAGSEVVGLGAGNLQTQQASDAYAWRTAGALTSAAGAYLIADTGAVQTWRAFILARTNLTAAATVRWRLGPASAVVEEVPGLALDFSDPAAWVPPAGWAFTRTGTATRTNALGLIETVTANVMRYDFDPVTLACRGLLVEVGRTNLLLQSAALDNAAWTKSASTITADARLAPDGTTSMDKVAEDATNATHYIAQSVAFTAAATTFSIYVAAGERTRCALQVFGTVNAVSSTVTLPFDIAAGSFGTLTSSGNLTVTSSSIETLANGVYRIAVTATPSLAATLSLRLYLADATGLTTYAGTAGNGLFAWGAQCETGATPSTYIPTTAATVARGSDVATCSAPTNYNAAEGTWAGQVLLTAYGATGLTRTAFSADTGSNAERVAGRFESYQLREFIQTGGSTTGSVYTSFVTPGQLAYFAVAFQSGTMQAATRIAALGTSTYSALPAAATTIYVGSDRSGTIPLMGCVRSLRYYPRRLTNGQILGFAVNGTTLDSSVLTYDSGAVASVAAGYGQAVTVLGAAVSGQVLRCDLSDAANPDGYISIGAAWAGDCWQPGINIGPDSGIAPERGADDVRTRSGATFRTQRYYARAWNIAHDGLAAAELWPRLMLLDRTAASGTNMLFVPDPAGADVGRETVLGLLGVTSDVSYRTLTGSYRAWRARIVERL